MLVSIISDAIRTATTVTNVVKTMGCRTPDPEYRIKWDPKEERIRLEEKKRDIFDPRVY